MSFCSKCGQKMDSKAKFCSNCGTAKIENETGKAERKIIYEGTIHKCPNCGEVVKAFETVCPTCGYEFRGRGAVDSLREFALKLEQIEAQREIKKSRPIKERLYGEEITKTDEQKISLIRSFAIPNTKEDLYEFLIMAESNIDIDLYDGTVLKTDARIAVSDAWKAKFEQAYQKAKILFDKNDVTYQEIEKLYEKVHKEIKKTKGKQWKIVGGIFGALLIVIAILCIAVPISQKQRDKKLEGIVQEIEEQLQNGEYKLALMNAKELDSGTSFGELERKWRIQREYWIDKIIAEAAKAGVILEEDVQNDDLLNEK